MAEILQAKKAGYPLDMEGFGLSDKCRIRADSEYHLLELNPNFRAPEDIKIFRDDSVFADGS